jgi:hypothetical protein
MNDATDPTEPSVAGAVVTGALMVLIIVGGLYLFAPV